MKITDLLKKDGIELNAVAADQNGAIDKLIELHSKVGNLTDAAKFKEAILAREEKVLLQLVWGLPYHTANQLQLPRQVLLPSLSRPESTISHWTEIQVSYSS